MSIEIWQFPKSATVNQLKDCLLDLGYVRCKNMFWTGPTGTISFFWEERKDFMSTSGVDASIFPLDAEWQEAWHTHAEWALRTRTSIWASTFDQSFQNETVKHIRKAFGGSFYNDHFGNNRYIVIECKKSTPVSRGIYGVVTELQEELDKLEHALPAEMIQEVFGAGGEIGESSNHIRMLKFAKQLDPVRIVYNALVPFLVAVIEHFFRECFEIMLKYNPLALKKLEEQNRKLSFSEAVAINRSELTIEHVASGWYSFQNLESIQKAYKDVLDIDIWKLLHSRRRVLNKSCMIDEALKDLIGTRHGVIHHFILNRDLDRNGFLYLINFVKTVLEVVSEEIERKLDIKLDSG